MKQLTVVILFFLAASHVAADASKEKWSFDEYIRGAAVPREVIDGFIRGPAWARSDPEVGYDLGNSLTPWGMGGSATIQTTQADGARTSILYRGKVPRINTYGDSFTECAQVSDGETWQECLAAHGEPVRNFGVGDHGVYQAYLRMAREENTEHGAKLLILTICCDDSIRSLLRARHAITYPSWDDQDGRMFHGNFWSHIEMDLNRVSLWKRSNCSSRQTRSTTWPICGGWSIISRPIWRFSGTPIARNSSVTSIGRK